ncbi:MAG: hypothetical protein R6V56_06145, partial [Lentisphaeria bacterium]
MVTEVKNMTSDWVEEAAMDAVDGNQAALKQLIDALAVVEEPIPRWQSELGEAWDTCFDLLDDNLNVQQYTAVIMHLARLDYDNQPFRDALARLARLVFDEYGDPAGLITSLGIHHSNTPTATVYQRWHRMRYLEDNALVYHPAHGAGKVSEVDDLSNEVRINFEQPVTFELATVLNSCTFVKPGTELANMLTKGGERSLPEVAEQILSEMPDCLVPSQNEMQIIRTFLVPERCTTEEFQECFEQKGREKAMSAAKSGTDKDNPEEVELHTSRSLTELLMRLRQVDRVDAGDEALRKTVSRLLEDSCDKKNSIDSFVEAVARLYQKTNDTAWLADLTKNLAVKTAPWQDKEI